MTEENVTIGFIEYLEEVGYNILHFDYPQSGGGFLLHSKHRTGKHDGSVKPDVVFEKDHVYFFAESKCLFSSDDIAKLKRLRDTDDFDQSLCLHGIVKAGNNVRIGVVLMDSSKNRERLLAECETLDFAFVIAESGDVIAIEPT